MYELPAEAETLRELLLLLCSCRQCGSSRLRACPCVSCRVRIQPSTLAWSAPAASAGGFRGLLLFLFPPPFLTLSAHTDVSSPCPRGLVPAPVQEPQGCVRWLSAQANTPAEKPLCVCTEPRHSYCSSAFLLNVETGTNAKDC